MVNTHWLLSVINFCTAKHDKRTEAGYHGFFFEHWFAFWVWVMFLSFVEQRMAMPRFVVLEYSSMLGFSDGPMNLGFRAEVALVVASLADGRLLIA